MPKILRWILTGFGLIGLGLALFLGGLLHNGQHDLSWQDGHFTVLEMTPFKQNIAAFKSVKLDTDEADVQLVYNNQQQYRISGTVRNVALLHTTVKNHVLHIKYKTINEPGWEVGFGERAAEKIVISVPRQTTFKRWMQESIGSDVRLANLQADTVQINANWADIKLADSQIKDLSVDQHDGVMDMHNNQLQQTTINMGDTKLQATHSHLGKVLLSGSDSTVRFIATQMMDGVMQLNDSKIKLIRNNITGNNTITMRDGNFKAEQLKSVGLQLQTTGKLTVDGGQYAGQFIRDEAATNRLNIVATDGNIQIN